MWITNCRLILWVHSCNSTSSTGNYSIKKMVLTQYPLTNNNHDQTVGPCLSTGEKIVAKTVSTNNDKRTILSTINTTSFGQAQLRSCFISTDSTTTRFSSQALNYLVNRFSALSALGTQPTSSTYISLSLSASPTVVTATSLQPISHINLAQQYRSRMC